MKLFYLTSFLLFSLLQYSLLLSNNSVFSYWDYKHQLDTRHQQITKIKNDSNEVKNIIFKLNNNNDALEIYAREIFGYIKKDEIFIQIIKNDSINN
tara:strand:+ start:1248 stop:1535 length:288 start_codon:yes stop_codon:yes gene_type:complete